MTPEYIWWFVVFCFVLEQPCSLMLLDSINKFPVLNFMVVRGQATKSSVTEHNSPRINITISN